MRKCMVQARHASHRMPDNTVYKLPSKEWGVGRAGSAEARTALCGGRSMTPAQALQQDDAASHSMHRSACSRPDKEVSLLSHRAPGSCMLESKLK